MSVPSSPRAGAPLGVAQPYDPLQGNEDGRGVLASPSRGAEIRPDYEEQESPVYLSMTSRPCTLHMESRPSSRSASPSPAGGTAQPRAGHTNGEPSGRHEPEVGSLASQVMVDVPPMTTGDDPSEPACPSDVGRDRADPIQVQAYQFTETIVTPVKRHLAPETDTSSPIRYTGVGRSGIDPVLGMSHRSEISVTPVPYRSNCRQTSDDDRAAKIRYNGVRSSDVNYRSAEMPVRPELRALVPSQRQGTEGPRERDDPERPSGPQEESQSPPRLRRQTSYASITLSPSAAARPALEQRHLVELRAADMNSRPDQLINERRGSDAWDTKQPPRGVAPSDGPPGAREFQEVGTPVKRRVHGRTLPGSPQEPFEPSPTRRGDVMGYTTDQQGFTAMLRLGDDARDRGRPIAAAQRYPGQGFPACKRLDFAPARAQHPETPRKETELDAMRRDLHNVLTAQREASQRQQAQLREASQRHQTQLWEASQRHEAQMRDLIVHTREVEERSKQHQDQLRHEMADAIKQSMDVMREGLARVTQTIPDLVRGLAVASETEPAPISASTPRSSAGSTLARSGCSMEAEQGSPQRNITDRPLVTREEVSPPQRGTLHADTPVSQRRGESPTEPGQHGQAKVNKNQVKLPEFAGKPGESLQSFLNKVENGARLGAWTTEYKMGQLYAQITGGALQYIDALPEVERETFEGLCAALRRRYEGELEREKSKEALRAVRRGRNEALEDLGRRITELTRKAYPPERREEEGVCAMRQAVNDRMADQIVIQGYKTVDQCVTALSKLECIQEQRSRHRQAHIAQGESADEVHGRTPGGATPSAKGGAQSTQAVRAVNQPAAVVTTATKDALRELFGPVLDQIRESARALDRSLRQERAERTRGARGPGGGPSKDRPCGECGSAEHWVAECPKAKKRSGKGRGLAPGSADQSKRQ